MTFRTFPRLLAPALLATTAAAPAQNTQTPGLVPGLENFDLSGPRPAPISTPTPTPTRTPLATDTSSPQPATSPSPARPSQRPTPAATSASAPASTPAPAPTPIAAPVSTGPAPAAAATPLSAPAAVALPANGPSASRPLDPRWLLPIGALLILGGVSAYLFYRRRRPVTVVAQDPYELIVEAGPRPTPPLATSSPQPVVDPPLVPPPPSFLRPPPKPAAPAPRARLEVTLRPLRAGANLTSAAVDYEIEIRNVGDAPALAVTLDLRLLSASVDQDALLDQLRTAPIVRPAVAPFDLPAGERVSLGGVALLPNDAINTFTAQGRRFFVPLLSIDLRYGRGDGAEGQTAAAYVIGIDRGGEKMAPFGLDAGPRMYDRVAHRPHGAAVLR